jgi:trk system potassium uptake protein TrkH
MNIVKKRHINQFITILHYFGDAGIVMGVFILIPIIVALIYHETKFIIPFLSVGLITIIFSSVLKLVCKKKSKMTIRLSMFLVMFVWLFLAFLGSLPYYFSGELSFLNSYFEAMSGFTTTGFTMFSDFYTIPYTINFWRGLTQWLGGLGIIFMVLTFMQTVGNDIIPLYNAEGRDERIFPSIRHTTKLMLYIYLGFTVLGVILFILVRMPIFDSVFYTFTALSGGGFAMSSLSIYNYHSFPIEVVAMLLMILGATNFNLHYIILRGKWREYFKDIETKVFFSVVIVSVLIIGIILSYHNVYGTNVFHNFRFALFQVVSAITTTGLQTSFAPQLHNGYNALGTLILTIIMIIGAGTGSTGGGIKWQRVGIMVSSIENQIIGLLEPSRSVVVNKFHHIRDIVITDKMVKYTLTFISIYLVVFAISVMVVLVFYNDLSAVLFEIASAMGNVGLGDGIINASSPFIVKIVYILDFWLGRLEIWPVLIVIYNILRKTKKTFSKI